VSALAQQDASRTVQEHSDSAINRRFRVIQLVCIKKSPFNLPDCREIAPCDVVIVSRARKVIQSTRFLMQIFSASRKIALARRIEIENMPVLTDFLPRGHPDERVSPEKAGVFRI